MMSEYSNYSFCFVNNLKGFPSINGKKRLISKVIKTTKTVIINRIIAQQIYPRARVKYLLTNIATLYAKYNTVLLL